MKVLYFAWIRERVGRGEESVDPPASVRTVGELIAWLSQRSPGHGAAFQDPRLVKVACDQTHVGHGAPLAGVREIAFFPPVTGG
jgi:molybdopterin synthase sulfur carrier subunit